MSVIGGNFRIRVIPVVPGIKQFPTPRRFRRAPVT